MHLYVYYDVALAHVAEATSLVRAAQVDVTPLCKRVRLQKRAPASGHAETWMEVYEHVTDGFEALLVEAVDRYGLATVTGARHVEHFVDID